jgi:hypothetical protein
MTKFPQNTERIATAWLEETIEGESLIRECVDRRLAGSVLVLVVINHDGPKPMVEVYGSRQVRPHIAQKIASDYNETQGLADRYLDLQLPDSHRRLYWPNKLRAVDVVERRTAGGELERRLSLAELKLIREIGKDAEHVSINRAM